MLIFIYILNNIKYINQTNVYFYKYICKYKI